MTGQSAAKSADETPFHLRSFIGPQHVGAWRAMKWHDDLLRSVFRDLDRDPPEYLHVRAPALGGKTTFAMQFIDRATSTRHDIFVAFLPLGGAIKTQEEFVQQVLQAFISGIDRLLDRMAETGIQASILELSEAKAAWEGLTCGELDELLRCLIVKIPTAFRRVVLMLDDTDRLADNLRAQLGEAFRTIHAYRSQGILHRFSVLLLARSLLRGPQAVSPLANVVKVYQLQDFSLSEFEAFLRNCEAVSGLRFEAETLEYLHRKTGGQAVMLQRILATATNDEPSSTFITLPDILQAVCRCYEKGGGVVDRLINVAGLSDAARLKLTDVLRENPVLSFEFEPEVAQLVDLGTLRTGDHRRLVCRSPLIRELYVSRFFSLDALPELGTFERYLLSIPNVLGMISSDRLLNSVSVRVRQGSARSVAPGTAERVAIDVLRKSGYPIDLREVQYCWDRYFGDLFPRTVTLDDIYEAVAKVLVAWSEEHEKQ